MNTILDRILYVTFTNYGYLQYTFNLIESIKNANTKWHILVVAVDKEAYQELLSRNIQCVFKGFSAKTIPLYHIHYQNNSFNLISFTKLDIILWLMEYYKEEVDNIVYMDSDIWVIKDFHDELKKYTEYDIVFQCDEGHKQMCSEPKCTNVCAGFFMCRNNDIVKTFLKYSDSHKYIHDQDYINKNLPNNINITTFVRDLFPNGVFIKELPENAMMIHYNYLEGEEKQKHMKLNGHWSEL